MLVGPSTQPPLGALFPGPRCFWIKSFQLTDYWASHVSVSDSGSQIVEAHSLSSIH